jgi:hypothetical protein
MARINWHPDQIIATTQRYTVPLVQKTGQEILDGARFLAPDGDHMSGSGKVKSGATLQQSLYSRFRGGPGVLRMRVGAKAKWASTVHQGSSAHTIRSRKGKKLKFVWDRGDFLVAARSGRRGGNKRTGRFHYFISVRHPGNKRPVQYLIRPLQMFGRINGFRVTSTPSGRSRLP